MIFLGEPSEFSRFGSYEDFQHLTEEVVDVEIMIKQLKFGICSTKDGKEKYKKTREYRLNRQIQRIEAAESVFKRPCYSER